MSETSEGALVVAPVTVIASASGRGAGCTGISVSSLADGSIALGIHDPGRVSMAVKLDDEACLALASLMRAATVRQSALQAASGMTRQ